ncbi:MAG: hypothetical protein WBA46_08180 [Thermomicrobiales bacterium]
MLSPYERKQSVVRVYTNSRDYAEDIVRFADEGWSVESVTERHPRRGCGRILLMGVIFAWIFPPKPELVVTYSRVVLDKGLARCRACGAINRYGKGATHCTTCGTPLTRT